MKWVEAHRKLDRGIPITDEREWKQIERSLDLFYWWQGAIFLALGVVFVVVWGIPNARKQEAEFVNQCESSGGVIDGVVFFRCIPYA